MNKISLITILCFFLLESISAQNHLKPDTLSIQFVGDIMCHDSQIKYAYDSIKEEYQFRTNFKYLESHLHSADLLFGNLETTFSVSDKYTGYPRFKSPEALARDLSFVGFDVLSTANNHTNDGGKRGLVHTLNILSRYGFYHTGAFASVDDRNLNHPLFIRKNGVTLGILNYTYGTNGIKTVAPTMVNLIDQKSIKSDITSARYYGADLVVVLLHWGSEYKLKANKDQLKLAKSLVDVEADIIVGGHPHVVQPVQFLEKSGSLVAYSLGNFISGQRKKNTDHSIILGVDILVHGPGQIEIIDYHYVPIYRIFGGSEESISVVPSNMSKEFYSMIDQKTYKKMNDGLKTLRKTLSTYPIREKQIKLPLQNIDDDYISDSGKGK